jgi:hypothetical protein
MKFLLKTMLVLVSGFTFMNGISAKLMKFQTDSLYLKVIDNNTVDSF